MFREILQGLLYLTNEATEWKVSYYIDVTGRLVNGITKSQWNDYTTHSKEDKEKMIEILKRLQEESQNIGKSLNAFWGNLYL